METSELKAAGRRRARSALTAMGRLTAQRRMRPGFLIAGAQRCGTTSLFRMLSEHPDVRPPMITKGIHYFDTADRYAKGPSFYGGHFPLHRADAQNLTITGEASPYYLFHPLAAGRIAAELPGVKIIVLLRDPVERAFSAYKQETGRGFETLSFERALVMESRRLEGEAEKIVADPTYQSFSHQHHAYVGRGQYADQLERMFAAVGRANVAVFEADQILSPELAHWPSLIEFLGLAEWAPATSIEANSRPSRPMPQLAKDLLLRQFDDSNERLPELLGFTPSWCR